MSGWVGALCLSFLTIHDSWGFLSQSNLSSSEDRHKAPTHPLIRPLSLQTVAKSAIIICLLFGKEDALHLGIQLRRVHSHFAPDAAAFIAAEGGFGMHAVAGVDGDHACADAPGDADAASEVARPDRARKAVGGIVGDAQRLLFAVEGDGADDRPENLVLGHAHSIVDVCQHRRLQVEAFFAAWDAWDAATGANQRRALLLAERDVVERKLALSGRDHRAKLGLFIERVADS